MWNKLKYMVIIVILSIVIYYYRHTSYRLRISWMLTANSRTSYMEQGGNVYQIRGAI